MRGLLLEETIQRLSFLRAAASVLVSGQNGIWSDEATYSKSAPEQTNDLNSRYTRNNPLNPQSSSRVDSGAAFLAHKTLTARHLSPDVTSTLTAQSAAVPSGSKRSYSDVEGELVVKKPRSDQAQESLSSMDAASSTEELELEGFFAALISSVTDESDGQCNVEEHSAQAEVANAAQQYEVSYGTALNDSTDVWPAPVQGPSSQLGHGEEWVDLDAWVDLTFDFHRNPAASEAVNRTDISDAQNAFLAEPTHFVDGATSAAAPAPAIEYLPAPVAPREKDTTPFYIDEWTQGHPHGEDAQSMPNEQNEPMSAIPAGALTSLMDNDSRASQDRIVAGASYNTTSTSHSQPSCDQEESFHYAAGNEGAFSKQQVVSSVEPSHLTDRASSSDASAPSFVELLFAAMPFADTYIAQELDKVPTQDALLVQNVPSMPSEEDQSVWSSIARPQTSLENLCKGVLQDQRAGPSHSAISPRHSEPSGDAGSAFDGTSKSPAPTSSEDSPLPLTQGYAKGPLGRPKKEKFTVYEAARKVLLSPDGANGIQSRSFKRKGTGARTHKANAPYLSLQWLMERLLLNHIVPAYMVELQTAFECYGYENVQILDLTRKVLNLAFSLEPYRLNITSDVKLPGTVVYLRWAVEMVYEAFFKDRPLRPDLKTYLRNKLRVQNDGTPQLSISRSWFRAEKRNMSMIKSHIRMINQVVNPKASLLNHPFNFTTFFADVCTLLTSDPVAEDLKEESSASTKKQATEGKGNKSKDIAVVGIVSKYKKLFNIDIAADVEAIRNAVLDRDTGDLFESAVRDGYIPHDFLRSDLVITPAVYNYNAHCLLSSIAALYRRLFEDTSKTNGLKGQVSKTERDLDASGGRPELDVVQRYLLQPLSRPNKDGRLSAEGFDPLSAASGVLKSWKQDLNPSLDTPDIQAIARELAPLTHSFVPFGTPQWLLTQLMHEYLPGKQNWRRDELRFTLDLCGYQAIDVKAMFRKAIALAQVILAKRVVPFDDAIELELPIQEYLLAADIIHAALFHTWPHRQALTEYFAKQRRYEVMPQHMKCLSRIQEKIDEWHPYNAIRRRKGGNAVVLDWQELQKAKSQSMTEEIDHHPLSFDRFWEDVTLVTDNDSSATPEIVHKYEVLFGRDIVEDLAS
eukprot:Blabericola_migrator_1__2877@NODE_1826_length_3731_cov_76_397380_g606_i3_p1_GENE_NODE_1826_length_3731_cov_76_397380_g606_i3NODE_1826_length_3731_cov_76_397380_g606_i3_p1_ORF_typecomplete_len1139_score182_25_NODE_1826_length_3731_cov_76_397380_g606_i313417